MAIVPGTYAYVIGVDAHAMTHSLRGRGVADRRGAGNVDVPRHG